MVELKGSLSGITLLSIFQLIGELHHSGTLHLDQGDDHAMLSFDDGRLVGAESGTQHGLQAVDSARKLTEADFTFIEGAATLPRTLDLGLADLKALLTRVQNGETVETDGLATVTTGNSSEVEVALDRLSIQSPD